MLRILCLFLLPFLLHSQSSNWNSIVDLNLSVNWNDYIDLYTDEDGNHILVENGSTLKYYLYSYSGSQVRNYTIDGSISSTFSKVTGWDGNIYVSYKEGSTIYTKKSTNAGQNWSGLANISLDDSDSDGLELWTDNNGLHIVYSEWDDNDDEYETYYKLSEHLSSNWINDKTVTDETEMYGGRPSVTTSSNRVHVAFNDEYDDAYTRDKYNSSWQTSQTVATWYTLRNMVISTSGKIHALYFELNLPKVNFKYKNRNLSGSTWSSAILIADQTGSVEHSKPDMAVTADDKMQLVYYYYGDLAYRVYDGSMSNAYDVMELVEAPRISTDGNDIYVIGITDDGSSGYEIKMRHRDYAPIAPTLALDSSGDHPVLSWNKPNADAKQYKIFRKSGVYGNFVHIATTTNLTWTDNNVDFSKPDTHYWYKIKAVDYSDNESDFSNTVDVWGMHKRSFKNPITSISSKPENFELMQNYPNPFNPSTSISFSLPKASHVILKIYDVHGNLVSDLLDVYKNAGIYEVEFIASKLPSGLYFYYLNADGFKASKLMLLVK